MWNSQHWAQLLPISWSARRHDSRRDPHEEDGDGALSECIGAKASHQALQVSTLPLAQCKYQQTRFAPQALNVRLCARRPLPSVRDLVKSLRVIKGGNGGGIGTEMQQVHVTIHGVERRVSHPLTMWGLQRLAEMQLRGGGAARAATLSEQSV